MSGEGLCKGPKTSNIMKWLCRFEWVEVKVLSMEFINPVCNFTFCSLTVLYSYSTVNLKDFSNIVGEAKQKLKQC